MSEPTQEPTDEQIALLKSVVWDKFGRPLGYWLECFIKRAKVADEDREALKAINDRFMGIARLAAVWISGDPDDAATVDEKIAARVIETALQMGMNRNDEANALKAELAEAKERLARKERELQDQVLRFTKNLQEAYEKHNKAEARVGQHERDQIEAASDCAVELPEPGTDAAKLLRANRLLRHRNLDLEERLAQVEADLEVMTEDRNTVRRTANERAEKIAQVERERDDYEGRNRAEFYRNQELDRLLTETDRDCTNLRERISKLEGALQELLAYDMSPTLRYKVVALLAPANSQESR